MSIFCTDCSQCTSAVRCEAFNEIKEQYQLISSFSYSKQRHSMPTHILLGVTNACNLSCPYCFVHQKQEYMTYEIAEKSVEWVLANAKNKGDSEKPSINFFGGEPLLAFDTIIKPLVEKWHEKINFGITTNGVLLDEDKVDFFYHYDVNILLSFDGIPEVQNKQRPGKGFNSFDTILRNIPYLLVRFPNTTMRATVTKDSIPYIYDSVLMAEELGFSNISFCPNAFEDWDKETENQLYEQFTKVGFHIYKSLITNKPVIQVNTLVKYFTNINKAIDNNLYFNNDIERCGLGTTTCAITYDGKIVPCQEKVSNPTVVLGDIYNGIDPIKHKKYLVDYFNKVNSITCDRGCSERDKLMCLSDICPSRMEDLDYVLSTSHCAWARMVSKVSARLHYLCSKVDNSYVNTYFNEKEGAIC